MNLPEAAFQAWGNRLGQALFGAPGPDYWRITRAAAFTAYLLLWASTVLGLVITGLRRRGQAVPPALTPLHDNLAFTGWATGLFHAAVLLLDRYVRFDLGDLAIPFTAPYRPVATGLGTLGLYAVGGLLLSFDLKSRLGSRAWRLIHYGGSFAFLLLLAHGIAAGTDSESLWARALYAFTGATAWAAALWRAGLELPLGKEGRKDRELRADSGGRR